jgi:hypothetical protein
VAIVLAVPGARLSLIEFPADDPERARRFWTALLGDPLEQTRRGGLANTNHSWPSRSSPFSALPGPRAAGLGLVQLADLLLDSEGQALDWFYGLFPSCATQQRAERTG